jgi:hypothetical protein
MTTRKRRDLRREGPPGPERGGLRRPDPSTDPRAAALCLPGAPARRARLPRRTGGWSPPRAPVRPVPETATATCSPRWASCWARRPKPATRPPIKIEQRRVVAEPRIQNLGGHRNSDRIRCYSEVIAVSHQRIRARFQQIDREEKGPTRNPPAPLIRHPRSSRCGADARQATRPSAGHADPGTFG